MKKTIVLLISVFLLGNLVVVALYFVTQTLHHRENPFIRLFPPHPIRYELGLDIGHNSYYVAGGTSSRVYLGNFAAPLHLLSVSLTNRTDTQHVRLNLAHPELLMLKTVNVQVDTPYFYVTNGMKPVLLRGRMGEWVARRFMYDSAYFTLAVPMGHSSFAIRSVLRSANEHILSKESNAPPFIEARPGVLVKQVDGLFCTDGMMHYNRDLKTLVYLYHYRNEFICMDTNLYVTYRGKTIDTISHAQIKVASMREGTSFTMLAPPLMVNKASSVSGNYLFVQSDLRAKNESEKAFRSAAVIDVYDLRDGSYRLSFYLHDFNKEKLTTFRVINDKLVALHGQFMAVYSLVPRHFDLIEADSSMPLVTN